MADIDPGAGLPLALEPPGDELHAFCGCICIAPTGGEGAIPLAGEEFPRCVDRGGETLSCCCGGVVPCTDMVSCTEPLSFGDPLTDSPSFCNVFAIAVHCNRRACISRSRRSNCRSKLPDCPNFGRTPPCSLLLSSSISSNVCCDACPNDVLCDIGT